MPSSTSQSMRLDDVEKEITDIRDAVGALRTELREHRELSRDRHQAILDKIESTSAHGSPPAPKDRPVVLGIMPGTAREIVLILGGLATAVATVTAAYLGAQSTPAAVAPASIHQPITPEAP